MHIDDDVEPYSYLLLCTSNVPKVVVHFCPATYEQPLEQPTVYLA